MISTNSQSQTSDGFLPAVEGLRALAVTGVLLYHLDLQFMPGGYLGVDLFFVISGYIITRNIIRELDRNSFSFSSFYYRRFRRLLPALVVVVFLSLVAGLAIVPPEQLAAAARSAMYSLFSLSNISFWMESGYFDAGAETKPFLHTWSLGVEEQFYLLWPALLLFAFRRHVLIAVPAVLMVLSIAASVYSVNEEPEAVFYLLPFRVHQFMAGALLAVVSIRIAPSLMNCLSVVGVVILSIGFLRLSGATDPASSAILATVAGSVMIASHSSNISQRLLGSSVMLWVGARSYAIYLVHWPLIVLWKYRNGFELNLIDQSLLFLVSLVLASLLHKLVEKPFRKRGLDITFVKRNAAGITVGTLCATVFLSSNIWGYQGYPLRVDEEINEVLSHVDRQRAARLRIIKHGTCNLQKSLRFEDYRPNRCARLEEGISNVLVIGDSHAADTYMLLRQTHRHLKFWLASSGSCPAIVDLPKDTYSTCKELNSFRFNTLVRKKFDLIVLASNWREDRIEPLKQTIDYLDSLGKRTLVFGPRAIFSESIPLFVSQKLSLAQVNKEAKHLADTQVDLLESMKQRLGETKIIDTAKLQCDSGCKVFDSGKLYYWDDHHLTREGARYLGEKLKTQFDIAAYIEEGREASGSVTSL